MTTFAAAISTIDQFAAVAESAFGDFQPNLEDGSPTRALPGRDDGRPQPAARRRSERDVDGHRARPSTVAEARERVVSTMRLLLEHAARLELYVTPKRHPLCERSRRRPARATRASGAPRPSRWLATGPSSTARRRERGGAARRVATFRPVAPWTGRARGAVARPGAGHASGQPWRRVEGLRGRQRRTPRFDADDRTYRRENSQDSIGASRGSSALSRRSTPPPRLAARGDRFVAARTAHSRSARLARWRARRAAFGLFLLYYSSAVTRQTS